MELTQCFLSKYCEDFRKKITQPYGKGQTKDIDFSPKLIVVDGFKIALTKVGEKGMGERKQNWKASLRTISKKEFGTVN